MTENEAKEILKDFNEKRKEFVEHGLNTRPSYFNKKQYQRFTKSIEMAISAFEKIQQYRALGTVEEIEPYIRLAEKLNVCDLVKENAKVYNKLKLTELELREATEKQRAKKPVLVTREGELIKFYPCPNCSTSEKYVSVYPKQKYCVECGQHIDWSE